MQIKINDIDNPKQKALVFLMMEQPKDIIKAIVNTDEWKLPENKDDKIVNVTVQYNGVEADPKSLEKLIVFWHNDMETTLKKQYSDIEAEIERRVSTRLQEAIEERINPYSQKLQATIEKLQEAEMNLSCVPYISDHTWKNENRYKDHELERVQIGDYYYWIPASDIRELTSRSTEREKVEYQE